MSRGKRIKHFAERKDLVEIEWEDSCGTHGWEDRGTAKELTPLMCRTVGYLMRKDRICAVTASSLDENGRENQFHICPTACVKKITVLRKAKEDK